MRIIQDKGRKSNARFQRIWPCKPKTCRAIRGNCGPPFSAAGSGGRGECGRRDLIRLAVPGKCRARRRSLAFFDRCGNCGFAASAPGGAKPQFPRARWARGDQLPFLRRRNKYPPSVGWGIFVWRRRRDLNPRGVFRHPTPLAGEPLRPLGYFCMPMLLEYISTRAG